MENKNIHTERSRNIPQLRFPGFEGEWVFIILGDLKVSMCKRILKEQTSFEGEIPFYKIGTFGKQADSFISKNLYEDYKNKYSFPKKGDILISAAGTIGRTVIYDGCPAYFQDSNIVWISNNENLVSNHFLSFCYKNIKWNTENTTIARLYNNNLKSIKIVVPETNSEQTRIAAFLTAVDKRVNLLQKKKAELELYKKGVMQKLFSSPLLGGDAAGRGGIRFKNDDGNNFPDWEDKKLGEVCEIIGGGTPSTTIQEYWNGEFNWFTPTEIKNKYIQGSQRKISVLGLKKSSAKLLPKNTLLFTSRATIGDVGIAQIECTTNQGFQSFLPNESYETEYLYYWLILNKKKFLRKSSGSTFIEISKGEISKIQIIIPCLKEQQKIASFLSSIDQSIKKIGNQIDASREWKKGLLQKMFC